MKWITTSRLKPSNFYGSCLNVIGLKVWMRRQRYSWNSRTIEAIFWWLNAYQKRLKNLSQTRPIVCNYYYITLNPCFHTIRIVNLQWCCLSFLNIVVIFIHTTEIRRHSTIQWRQFWEGDEWFNIIIRIKVQVNMVHSEKGEKKKFVFWEPIMYE